ncbi:MAG: hypothetical protein RAP03_03280, partial [Candidatus Electryonea clarkiae]|nr:hypothetical protein [Candidatus Electryonea clarkiae]
MVNRIGSFLVLTVLLQSIVLAEGGVDYNYAVISLLADEVIEFQGSADSAGIGDITFSDEALEDTLLKFDVYAIEHLFSDFDPADTLSYSPLIP